MPPPSFFFRSPPTKEAAPGRLKYHANTRVEGGNVLCGLCFPLSHSLLSYPMRAVADQKNISQKSQLPQPSVSALIFLDLKNKINTLGGGLDSLPSVYTPDMAYTLFNPNLIQFQAQDASMHHF